jgi:hypothetical protein
MTAPFQPHSATSKAAAKAVEPKLNGQQRMIRRYLTGRGPSGATDEEIALDLGFTASTARPRRVELVELGLVKDSGKTRAGSSGRKMTVWIACEPTKEADPIPHTEGRASKLKKAAAPFVHRARELLEDPIVKSAHDETTLMVRMRLTPGQLKALIEAWEG